MICVGDAPTGCRPVSLSTISLELNDTVAIDYKHLDGLDILHCMDVSTRYSTDAVVECTHAYTSTCLAVSFV